jgi:lipoprotein-releasing system permease protein
MNGLTDTVANLYNAFEPDLKITASKGKYFEAREELLNKIRKTEGVLLVSKTISDKALIKNGDRQSLVSVKGIDANFNKITNIDSVIVEGRYGMDDTTISPVLLGRGIANQLQVNLSSFVTELSFFSPARGKAQALNPMDNMNQVYGRPQGIFSLNDEFDFQYVFVTLETARKLFDSPDRISALELSCKEGQAEGARKRLQTLLGPDFVIKNRYQLNDALFKSLETEKLATFIILAFILVIATFNIIGALTMLIIEKRRDIKTLYSLGADLGLIRNIFMREGLLISGIGAIIGLLLGLTVCWLQLEFHLVKFGSEFVIPYYPIELQAADFARIFVLIMAIGFLAALYPIRIFTRMDVLR